MIGIGNNLVAVLAAAPGGQNTGYSSGAHLEFNPAERGTANAVEGAFQIACARAGTATVTNQYGVMQLADDNTPRLDYDPLTLRYENQLFWSEDFSNALWSKQQSTAIPGYVTPHGAPAFKLVEDSSTGEHYFRQANLIPALTAGSSVVFSVDLKAAERTFAAIRVREADATFTTAFINLSTGATGKTGEASAVVSATLNADGWYRLSLTFTEPNVGVNTLNAYIYSASSLSSASTVGDGVSGIFVARAQINSGTSILEYRKSGVTQVPKMYRCKGILDEDAATNLVTYSAQQDNAAWAKTAVSVTANAVIAPDDAVAADLLMEDSTTALHFTSGAVYTYAGSTTYTGSAYLKLNSGTRMVQLAFSSAAFPSAARKAKFNLVNGTVFDVNAGCTATITLTKYGFYRCTLTATTSASPTSGYSLSIALCSGLTESYLGDGTSSCYIWGAQVIAGTRAGSYIPTGATAVTRNADLLTVEGAGQFFSLTAGTVLVEFQTEAVTASATDLALFSIDDGVSSKRLASRISCDGGATRGTVRAFFHNGTTFTYSVDGGVYSSGVGKHLVAWATTNDFVSIYNGAVSGTDVSGDVSAATGLTTLRFGVIPGAGHLNGHIRRFALWRSRLPNAEGQAHVV